MRIEKCSGVWFKLRNRVVRRQRHLRLPSLHSNAPILRIDAGHHALCSNARSQRRRKLRIHCAFSGEKRRADNHASSTRVQHLPRALNRVNAAACLHRQPLGNLRHQRGVIPLQHRRVQIDQLHQRKARKFFNPVFKIIKGKAQFFALHKLNNLSAQQINRRNQHGSLTETPAFASSSLSERALETPK